MKKKTDYGKWLSSMKEECDAQIELFRDSAASATFENEAGYPCAIAALELNREKALEVDAGANQESA